ncbi:MAG TPA: DUF2442 domain-containing protein [Bacteroidetes bacterium]|nr:DUF2442 domain-containing protein [Bacteroidota bacterium]
METISQQQIITVNPNDVKIENGNLCFQFKGKDYVFKLKEITSRLAAATEKQILNYSISPSGYGIHWPELDEDISFSGLLKSK